MAEYYTGLLTEEALAEFKENGYYSTLIDSKRKLRLVNIFVGTDDVINFYGWKMLYDPGNQIQWLRKTLDAAEKAGEDVWILRHIPVGSSLIKTSNKHMMVLFERYANIIRGFFAAHTHNDELSYIRDSNGKFVGPQFVGGSLTTYGRGYPSFRTYNVDPETNSVVDYSQYRLDLDKNNANPSAGISYTRAYDLKDEYGMKDLSFDSYEKLDTKRQAEDPDFIKKYHVNYWRGYPKE